MSDPRKGLPSASDMERIANCPGCLQAEQLYSEKTEIHDYTQEGTDIAKALETGDTSELEEDTAVIADRLEKMTTQTLNDWVARTGETEYEEHRETRFWLTDSKGERICSAQVDRAYVGKTHALVIDHKSGYKEVPHSTKNKQLRTQGVCLQDENPWVEEVQVAIAAFRFKEQFTTAAYDRSRLLQSKREIMLFLWRAKDPEAERVSGPWCDYCPAKADCATAVTRSLMPASIVPEKPTDEQLSAAIHRLTPAQLAFVNSRRPLADKVFKAVSQRIRNLSDEELAEAGLELKPQTISTVDRVGPALNHLVKLGWLEGSKAASVCDIVMGRLVETIAPTMMKSRPDVFTSKSACAKALADELSAFQKTAPKAAMILKAKQGPKTNEPINLPAVKPESKKKETKSNERPTKRTRSGSNPAVSKRRSPRRGPKRSAKAHRGDDGPAGD